MPEAKSLSPSALSPGSVGDPHTVPMFGFTLNNLTMSEALRELMTHAAGAEPCQVSFVNADCVNIAARNDAYRTALVDSAFVFGDGIGMRIAGRAFGSPLRDNVNGTDLFPLLVAEMESHGRSLYLLGGKPGIADGVAQWVRERSPQTRIVGSRHGFFGEDQLTEVLAEIRDKRPDVLLVAFGAPTQELWLSRHLSDLAVPVGIGVGGLFDFFSGRIPRAPRWMRALGLEWIFRMYQEPRRLWKRYLVGNPVFLTRVLWHRRRRNRQTRKS